MRSTLFIFLCTISFVCAFPALANKAQLPHKITLQLNQAQSGQSLSVTSKLYSLHKFSEGSATLVLTKQGEKAQMPVILFSGKGNAGFNQSTDYQLPPLAPGKYKLHAVFTVQGGNKIKNATRTGTNLYIDVKTTQVLASNISFSHIERLQLKARLDARQKLKLSNETASLRVDAPNLYQSLNAINRIESTQINTIQAQPSDAQKSLQLKATQKAPVQILVLTRGGSEEADPRKLEKRNAAQKMDKENAVLETHEDEI
ncbi:MAG: hypothetical protein HRT35_15665 [Algicola sp.]|nr:hypothetical protein [Algicola sp.]